MKFSRAMAVWLVSLVVVSAGVGASAQGGPAENAAPGRGARGRGGLPPPPPNTDTMNPQQIEQYFDSVVLYTAKVQLQLSDDQFLRFGARLRQLQAIQRQYQRNRMMVIRDLNQLLAAPTADDAAVAGKVKEIDDLAAENGRQVSDANAAIDQVLTVRQRAKFRVFQETMERRKLDLLASARRATKAAQAP